MKTIESAAERPTRTRNWVIAFAASLGVITYIDRACISKLAPWISADLDLSKDQMSWVYSAFFWTYALFEIPGGWMGDRWGARRVLMRIVLWWSFFTAATGWVGSLWALIAIRALFGMGEAGAFPNLTRALMVWLPREERVRAQGITWLSTRWGGAITPLLVLWIVQYTTWRHAFEIFGLVGVVWAGVFFWWYRDDPRSHPAVNEAERKILPDPATLHLGHEPVPWKLFVTTPTVWLLWLQYSCLGYAWVFYITWLPTYINETFKEPWAQSELFKAAMAGIPLLFGGVGSLFSGWFARHLDARLGNLAQSRRWLAGTGHFVAAAFFLLSTFVDNPIGKMLLMGMASFGNDLAMPPSWGACMDVGRKYAGTLSGSMNMMTNLAQGLAPLITARLLRATGDNWNVVFYQSALIYLLGMTCWLLLDPVTPLEEQGKSSSPRRGGHENDIVDAAVEEQTGGPGAA